MASVSYPFIGGGGGVPIYDTFADFPAGSVAGDLAVAADTGNLYEWSGSAWQQIGGPGSALSLGSLDAQSATSKGAALTGGVLSMQSADATHPGLVNNTTQTLSGVKTFSSAPNLSSLTGSQALVLDGSKNIASSTTTATELDFVHGVTSAIQTQLDAKQSTTLTNTHLLVGNVSNVATDVAMSGDATLANTGAVTLATVNANIGSFSPAAVTVNAKGLVTAASNVTTGNLTDAGTDGITVTGGTGSVLGSGTSIAQHVADTTHNGYLSSTDWNTFNGKQASGNYITALTGDVAASGPGSVAATLATVNANTGSFGSSTAIPSFTVNGKGLVTAASTNAVIAPATTLTGTTLASNVVTSSLTTVGTIATGVWNGTAVDATHGGTAQTSWTLGDTLYSSAANTLSKLAGNTTSTKKFLVQTGTGSVSAAPSWGTIATGDFPAIPAIRYFSSTTTISGSAATVVYATKDYDSGGGSPYYVSGVFTAPIAGKYQINAGLRFVATIASGGGSSLDIVKNSTTTMSEQTFIAAGSMTGCAVQISDIIDLAASDTLLIQASTAGTSPSIASSNTRNYISIAWIGP